MALKCLHELAPACLCSKFVVRADVHSFNTRHRNKLDVKLFRTATSQCSFVYRASRLWNELSQTLTVVNTLVMKTSDKKEERHFIFKFKFMDKKFCICTISETME